MLEKSNYKASFTSLAARKSASPLTLPHANHGATTVTHESDEIWFIANKIRAKEASRNKI
jgi:hypothetical protein